MIIDGFAPEASIAMCRDESSCLDLSRSATVEKKLATRCFPPLPSHPPQLNFFTGMTKVRIMLIPEHRESLLSCLPVQSRVRTLLDRANQARSSRPLFDDIYELVCDKRDARILLESAKKSCPSAVEIIETAVKRR